MENDSFSNTNVIEAKTPFPDDDRWEFSAVSDSLFDKCKSQIQYFTTGSANNCYGNNVKNSSTITVMAWAQKQPPMWTEKGSFAVCYISEKF